MIKRDKIIVVFSVFLLAILAYTLYDHFSRRSPALVSKPTQSFSKQYRIEYNYPHEIRVILLGEFEDEEMIRATGRAAALELAKEASRDGYVEESVHFEVGSGVFVFYEDGSEKLFPAIKVYKIRKKN